MRACSHGPYLPCLAEDDKAYDEIRKELEKGPSLLESEVVGVLIKVGQTQGSEPAQAAQCHHLHQLSAVLSPEGGGTHGALMICTMEQWTMPEAPCFDCLLLNPTRVGSCCSPLQVGVVAVGVATTIGLLKVAEPVLNAIVAAFPVK